MTSAGSLAALLRQTHLDDHDAVLNEAQASLRKSKDDLNAQLVRVVALLKLDRYEDALRALEEGGEQLKERAKLETAYGLYKVGRWDEAQSLAKKVPTGRAFKHVEAQAVSVCLSGSLVQEGGPNGSWSSGISIREIRSSCRALSKSCKPGGRGGE